MNTLRLETTLSSKSLIGCALVLALLQGCGGGGGGGGGSTTSSGPSTPPSNSPTPTASAPAAPSASISFAMKQLQFSWAAVSGATSYKLMESTDGGATYTQVGGDFTSTGATRDIAVHLQNWAAARYQVQACNSNGCTASNTLSASTGVLQTIGYFKASNTGSGDAYGWTIALSGDGSTLAVGAPYEDSSSAASQGDNSAIDSGAVYVFTRGANGWSQQAYIKPLNIVASANFGEALSLSSDGSTLAVGAPFEDSATTTINSAPNHAAAGAGAAYVFSRSGNGWAQQAYIKANNTVADMYFGWSVALSDDGNTLAAGAPGEANSAAGVAPATMSRTAANSGAAYVFTRSSASWSQRTYIKASNPNAEDNFGAALALSGDASTLAVGAPYESSATTGIGGNQSDNSAAKSGAVYVFVGGGASWSQQTYMKASNTGAGDNFGAALALSDTGDTLAVGAPYESSSATGIGGAQTNNSAAKAGAAYVFKRSVSSWAQQAYVKASNTNANDDFGSSVALSSDGNALVVGAIGESANSAGVDGNQADNSKDGVGAAYLFNRSGSAWSQLRYIKPSAATLGDEFGTAIGLSADGTTLAISGAFEQSNATGVGGDQSSTASVDAGAVWLY